MYHPRNSRPGAQPQKNQRIGEFIPLIQYSRFPPNIYTTHIASRSIYSPQGNCGLPVTWTSRLTLAMASQCNFLTKANNDFPRQLISLINIDSFGLEEDPDRNHITSFTQYIELVNTDPQSQTHILTSWISRRGTIEGRTKRNEHKVLDTRQITRVCLKTCSLS